MEGKNCLQSTSSDSSSSSSAAGAGSDDDEKLRRRRLQSPDPCLLRGEPAVHYDWEGNVIKRERPPLSRLLHSSSSSGEDGGGDTSGSGSSSSLFNCLFKCFRIPSNQAPAAGKDLLLWSTKRANKDDASTLLLLPVCEACEDLVVLLLEMYDKVEELEDLLKMKVREAEVKFVEEGLYHDENYQGFYGNLRGTLLKSLSKQNRRRNLGKGKQMRTEEPGEIIMQPPPSSSSSSKKEYAILSAHFQDESVLKCEEDEDDDDDDNFNLMDHDDDDDEPIFPEEPHHHHRHIVDEVEERNVEGGPVVTKGEEDEDDATVSSFNEHEHPRPPADLKDDVETRREYSRRRRSPRRRKAPPVNIRYTKSSSSSSAEDRGRGSDDEEFVFSNDSSDEGSTSESESSSGSDDFFRADKDGVTTTKGVKANTAAHHRPSKSKLLLNRKRKLTVAAAVGGPSAANPQEKRQCGTCPVCEKPFDSFQSVAYHAHRMTHLSESEKAEALSNPVKIGRGKTRPKIPPVTSRRRITPEVASLRGNVNPCPTCGKLISDGKWGLRQHEARMHDVPGKEKRRAHHHHHICSICFASHSSKKSLDLHMSRTHHSAAAAAEDGGESPPKKRKYKTRSSSGSRFGICPVCCKPFGSIFTPDYFDHRLTHLSEAERQEATSNPVKNGGGRTRPRLPRIQDKKTRKITPELASLRGDINQCPSCGKLVCGGITGLERHSKVHLPEAEKRYHLCPLCGKAYTTKAHLEAHTKTTHPDGGGDGDTYYYECQHCSKSYTTKQALGWHTERVHPTLQVEVVVKRKKKLAAAESVQCMFPNCTSRGFPDEAALVAHVGQEHAQAQSSSSKGTIFMCSACGKVLVNDWSLKQHHLTHSEERRHGCPHCPARFRTRDTWTAHLGSVHGEGPAGGSFKCEQPGCDSKVFQGRKNFKRHLRLAHKIYEGRRGGKE